MDAEKRERMVARVKKVYDQYPSFTSLPEATSGDIHVTVADSDNTSYVNALHEICSKGEVIGRRNDEIFGQSDERAALNVLADTGRIMKVKEKK